VGPRIGGGGGGARSPAAFSSVRLSHGEAKVQKACGRNGSRGARADEGSENTEGALFFKGINVGPVRFAGDHLSNLHLPGGGPLAHHLYPQALGSFPDQSLIPQALGGLVVVPLGEGGESPKHVKTRSRGKSTGQAIFRLGGFAAWRAPPTPVWCPLRKRVSLIPPDQRAKAEDKECQPPYSTLLVYGNRLHGTNRCHALWVVAMRVKKVFLHRP